MTENKYKNNFQIILVECPICHIKLNKNQIQIHNIKCRKLKNQKDKNNNKNKSLHGEKLLETKDEFKNFIEKIPYMEIDDNNIKTIIKKFMIIFSKKIELLENNINHINDQIKGLNNNNSNYFKKISDTLDDINKKYDNGEEIQNEKVSGDIINIPYKKSFYKNETNTALFEANDNFKTPKIKKNIYYTERKEIEGKKSENYYNLYNKNIDKKKFISVEKGGSAINTYKNTEEVNQLNDNLKENNEKKISTKTLNSYYYSSKFFKSNPINITTFEENMVNKTSYPCTLKNLTNIDNNTDEDNRDSIKKYESSKYNEYNEDNEILLGSLDIIMEKITNLEKTLINLGLDDNDLKGKIFNLKSKELQYSNSDSCHSNHS